MSDKNFYSVRQEKLCFLIEYIQCSTKVATIQIGQTNPEQFRSQDSSRFLLLSKSFSTYSIFSIHFFKTHIKKFEHLYFKWEVLKTLHACLLTI